MCVDWLDTAQKILTSLGGLTVIIAAGTFIFQRRIRRAEWLTSLFKDFFQDPRYKEARVWLDYGKLGDKLRVSDEEERIKNEEKFSEFLNFFEYIGVLFSSKHITFTEVYNIFDYYLKKIKDDPDCQDWIQKYNFKKLKMLLNQF